MTIHLGIIGFASFYGPAYAARATAHSDCSVVAATATDVDDEALLQLGQPTREEFAAEQDCQIYEDVSEVFEVSDAVVIASRTTRRTLDARRALERDIPVLIAKPAANSYDAAQRLAMTADNADAPLAFTTPARYDDAIMGAAERIANDAIGDVVAVRAHIRHDRVPAAGIEVNAEHAPNEAGSTYAMAVYTADALLWLASSDPERVMAEYTNINSPHSTHPDLGTATVRFADNTLGTMTMTYSTDCREPWGNWEVEVVGTDGILRTTHQGYEGIYWGADDPDDRSGTVFARTTTPVLQRIFDAFVQSIRGNRPWNAPTTTDAAAALGLCCAWKQASKVGPITFNSWPPASLDE